MKNKLLCKFINNEYIILFLFLGNENQNIYSTFVWYIVITGWQKEKKKIEEMNRENFFK